MTANVGSIIIGVAVAVIGFLITRSISKADRKAEQRVIDGGKRAVGEHERINKRINHLILCSYSMFSALEELGVNGDIKKEMERLRKQVIDD